MNYDAEEYDPKLTPWVKGAQDQQEKLEGDDTHHKVTPIGRLNQACRHYFFPKAGMREMASYLGMGIEELRDIEIGRREALPEEATKIEVFWACRLHESAESRQVFNPIL